MVGDFGTLLRQHRLLLCWTQEDLAEQSGVSAHAISVLESGRRRPRLSSVARLATALVLDSADRDQLIAAARAQSQRSTESPARVMPRLLPYAVPDFTGRRDEVDRLLALASGQAQGQEPASALVISAIDGMAGVGKTALAVHVGHALADRFPDGQLFLDLHGFTPGKLPLGPGAALARLLRAVGVSELSLPEGTEERAQMWCTEAADRQLLVVLDNAADAAQVRPLIPGGPGCLVLVTSRRRMPTLDGAVGLPLDVLSHGEAVALFARIVGSDRVADHAATVDEIVTLCGRLPLALRIAAARLAHRPAWTPVELLVRLRRPQKLQTELSLHDRSVAAAFLDSYQALDPSLRRAFRLAALHPGEDFTPHALAALIDTPVEEAEEMESLHDHHLLNEHTALRYTFHDLLRDFADELVTREEPEPLRHAALVRLLDYYRQAAAAAMGVLAPLEQHHRPLVSQLRGTAMAFADEGEAADWLAVEQSNLLAVIRHTGDAGLPEYAADLPAILWRRLKRHMPAHEALVVGTLALDATRQLGNPVGEAAALRHLGLVRYQLGEFPQAIELLQQSLGIYRKVGNRTGQAHVLTNLGLTLARMGRLEEALDHHQRALELSLDIPEPAVEAIALINLGPTLTRLGRMPEALDFHHRALALHRRTGNRLGQAIALNQLGEYHQKLQRHPEALDLYQEALDLHRELGDTFGQAESHTLIGDTLLSMDALASALEHYQAAIEYPGERYNLARIHLGLARAHHRLGHPEAARSHAGQAVDIYASLDIPEAGQAKAFLDALGRVS
ncbi:ATP-binding protein [Kitasatospora paracochleata]|uniref:Tetratricopeptide (TPR) repeat protein/transcriptional regulator with XRE-family HTH domain n=1 Tax=Kitasatospora paracochleata TaxID=58354 RepID=A0ABT1J334_9ACTN|nr:helix-turn-helix domain-containing protein [Kitasatospora paracochleata]MCP2311832.1 tetratricopeptide (TPR) repeat protein/transcriptional regulator with XRE-family HTH domain [Kitasatospora paracochleata]